MPTWPRDRRPPAIITISGRGKEPIRSRKVYKQAFPAALRVNGIKRGTHEMPELSTKPVVHWFDALFNEGTLGGLSDAELIERFLTLETAGESAFEILLGRHGPMVLGVCRRILGDEHAADDAFQATFLVMVHGLGQFGAANRWVRGSMASRGAWRCGRRRTTGCAAGGSSERRLIRRRLPWPLLGTNGTSASRFTPRSTDCPTDIVLRSCSAISKGKRSPKLAQLGWPAGTVAGRLARARERLRSRLERRGMVVPTALAAIASDPAAHQAVPTALAQFNN